MDSIMRIAKTIYVDEKFKFESGALVQWKRKGDALICQIYPGF